MTNLPKANVTAGLNVPADSQVVPWGERMGSLDARVHAWKGRSVARAAKEREAARSDDVRMRWRFIFVTRKSRGDGPTKGGDEPGGTERRKEDLTQRTQRAQSSQRREKRKKRRNINAEGTPARPEQAPSTEFAEKRKTSLRTGQRESLWGLGGFGRIELHGADDAFAFFDEDHLVGLDVAEGLDEAAGPADFQELDVLGFADAEMDAQIILVKIAAAAAHFVNLRVQAFFAREMRDAFYARADAAAVRFCADGFDLDPIVARA